MTEADVQEASDDVDEEGPALEEDAYADVDPDIAAKVAEESADEDDDQEASDDVDDAGDADTAAADADDGDRTSVGHVYCRALGASAALSKERMGSGVDDRSETIDEYAGLAKELDLDDYMDQWYRENISGSEELSPGQGLVAMTSLFAVMILVDDADLLDGALDGALGDAEVAA